MDGIEQFIQSIMKFVNADITEDDFLKLAQLGAIKIKSEQGQTADVDYISSSCLQQTQYQRALICLALTREPQEHRIMCDILLCNAPCAFFRFARKACALSNVSCDMIASLISLTKYCVFSP